MRLSAISLVSLLAATMIGCGLPSPVPLAAPAASQAKTLSAPKAYLTSIAEMTLTSATATASEIERGHRPEGFYLEGRLADDYRTRVTLFYDGFEKVNGGGDVAVPNDELIGRMRPANGKFVVQLQASPQKKPLKHAMEPAEREAFIKAVQRAINAKPQGKNASGQTVAVVLGFARRVLTNPGALR